MRRPSTALRAGFWRSVQVLLPNQRRRGAASAAPLKTYFDLSSRPSPPQRASGGTCFSVLPPRSRRWCRRSAAPTGLVPVRGLTPPPNIIPPLRGLMLGRFVSGHGFQPCRSRINNASGFSPSAGTCCSSVVTTIVSQAARSTCSSQIRKTEAQRATQIEAHRCGRARRRVQAAEFRSPSGPRRV